MKLLGLVICVSLLAAMSFGQSIVTSNGGLVVTATSGDIHCVFAKLAGVDPLHVTCDEGVPGEPGVRTIVLNTFVNLALGRSASGNITTPDGNFISWTLAFPSRGNFTWDVNADGDEHTGTF